MSGLILDGPLKLVQQLLEIHKFHSGFFSLRGPHTRWSYGEAQWMVHNQMGSMAASASRWP